MTLELLLYYIFATLKAVLIDKTQTNRKLICLKFTNDNSILLQYDFSFGKLIKGEIANVLVIN